MFYIGIKSGLGNQMFQYAFGVAASMESGIPLALDISNYGRQFAKDTPRSFTLQHFNIQAPIATDTETVQFHNKVAIFLRRLKLKFSPNNNYKFDPQALKVKHGQYLEGFWQSYKYFEKYEKTVRAELTLKNPLGLEALTAVKEIEQKKAEGYETIMIHVRRGDYVTNPNSVRVMGVLNADYFRTAIERIEKEIDMQTINKNENVQTKPKHIFFASEDTEWIKEHIKPHHSYSFITRPGILDFEELMVMSTCDHFIISNSSYSWWAAWLAHNPQKIVIAPKRWVVDTQTDTSDALPPTWIKVENTL